MSSGNARYVYVTGCDSGFGNLSIKMFNDKGFKVFAGVFLDASLAKLKSEYPDGKCVPVKLDVTKEVSVNEAAQFIKEHLAKEPGSELYALVNNAGILVQPCPVEWQNLTDFRQMMEVNLFGMVSVTQSVLPLIRASKGRIVCTSSIAGRMGIPTQAAYCASKYAVQGYADVLRRDMIPWGVTVHIIEPGVFPNTGLYERFQTGLDHVWSRLSPELKAEYGEEHYLFQRRLLGFALKEFGTLDSTLVPKAYVEAVTSSKAKYRYRVGADSKYLVTILANVHESTADTISTIEDPRMPYVKPVKAPKDGKALAFARYDHGWKRFLVICALVTVIVLKLRRTI